MRGDGHHYWPADFSRSAVCFFGKEGSGIAIAAAEGTDAANESDTEVVSDGYFHESEYRSAPYFDVQIDRINLLDTAF